MESSVKVLAGEVNKQMMKDDITGGVEWVRGNALVLIAEGEPCCTASRITCVIDYRGHSLS